MAVAHVGATHAGGQAARDCFDMRCRVETAPAIAEASQDNALPDDGAGDALQGIEGEAPESEVAPAAPLGFARLAPRSSPEPIGTAAADEALSPATSRAARVSVAAASPGACSTLDERGLLAAESRPGGVVQGSAAIEGSGNVDHSGATICNRQIDPLDRYFAD